MKKLTIIICCILLVSSILNFTGTALVSQNIKISNRTTILENNFNLFGNVSNSTNIKYAPSEIIVKFNDEISLSGSQNDILFTSSSKTDLSKIYTLNNYYGLTSIEKIFTQKSPKFLSNIFLLRFNCKSNMDSIIQEYGKISLISYVQPNCIYHANIIPNDPLFGDQWSLDNIGQKDGLLDADIDAPEAWEIETGDNETIVAVIDSGVDYLHNDLANNIWINMDEIPNNDIDDDNNGFIDDVRGWDFANSDNNPMDDNGHGTFCSGIISGTTNNEIGIAGVTWDCKIMPLKFLSYKGFGTTIDAINSILYAINNGARVLSNSWGGYMEDQLLENTFNYAYAENVLPIAAAGNDDTILKQNPSGFKDVISVTASNNRDKKPYYSNYGKWVDIAAPGDEILSTMPSNKYSYGYGTSAACPHVSGLAALILSKNPNLTVEMLKTIIYSNTDELNTLYYLGRGRINAYKTLNNTLSVIALLDKTKDVYENHEIINIIGRTGGDDFEYYVVEYGVGLYPNTFIEFANSTTPIYNGTLALLDTNNLEDNYYCIQLRVSASGKTFKDKTYFLLDNEYNYYYVDDDNTNGPWNGSELFPYQTITSAIYSSGDKDEIFVKNGFYQERISITKSINLTGENKENTIISGSDEGNVIFLMANDTIITNFKIQDSFKFYWTMSNGLKIFQGKNNKIYDNIFTKNSLDISLFNSSNNNTIKDNKIISDGEYGISIFDSSNNTIYNNKITSHFCAGIQIYGFYYVEEPADNNVVLNNDINNNDFGIDVWGSNYLKIFLNTITNCRIGIDIFYSKLNEIKDNVINNIENRAIRLYFSKAINITNNTLTDSNLCIYLECSNNINISKNKISKNYNGIELLSSCNNSIYLNTIEKIYGRKKLLFRENGALYLYDNSNNNYIIKNNFIRNRINARFYHSYDNLWDNNYWERPKISKKIIIGFIEGIFFSRISFNYDFNPSKIPN